VENNFEKLPALSALPGGGYGCAFSPDGRYLAAVNSGASPFITVYDVENNFEKLPALSALPGNGRDCAFSGKYLAAVNYGYGTSPYITVYDVENNFEKLPALSALPGGGYGCAFSPDGKYLAAAHSTSPYITVYDVENNFTKLPALSALPGGGEGCAFSPDGRYLAAAHNSSPYITVYDVENNFEKLPALSALPNLGWGCAFSPAPDGKYLAAVHNTSPYVTVYDVENNFTKLPALSALPGAGRGCAFSPDGKYLAAAVYDALPYITVYDIPRKYPTSKSITVKWTFPPGTGTGEIKELVLGTSTSDVWTSRVALDYPINKTEFHELEVEWQLTMTCEPTVTGVIPAGQIDGETDVSYTFEFLPHMFHNITMSNGHTPWFGTSSWKTPALALGEGDEFYPFGEGNGILGTQFARYATSAIREVSPYVDGSLERTFRIFLETNQGNDAPISEMALEGFGRIVFNPPLEKVDTHRLYVDVTLKIEREGE
jgi:6-phosphogluconolactonase (cycloisomerase 2 family)